MRIPKSKQKWNLDPKRRLIEFLIAECIGKKRVAVELRTVNSMLQIVGVAPIKDCAQRDVLTLNVKQWLPILRNAQSGRKMRATTNNRTRAA